MTRPTLNAIVILLAGVGLTATSTWAQDIATRTIDLPGGDTNWVPPDGQLRTAGLLTVDLGADLTPEELVDALLGPDVTVSNVTYTGANRAAGTFSGGSGIIGFDSGIILSSGRIASVAGPNARDNTSNRNFLPGDPDLNGLIPGYATHDATVLEFDFECEAVNVIQFQYVFASEEYNEWVDAIFNDVFGFFLNGQNIALVPGGQGLAVAINNVNCGNPYEPFDPNDPPGSFCNLYRNNDLSDGGGAINTEMDGLTYVFVATSVVNPGVNHIKLAIADAGDEIYDSNVFIKAESFVCEPPRGACCDLSTLICREDTLENGCQGADEVWSVGLVCADLDPPCVPANPPVCDAGGPYAAECAGGPVAIALNGSGSYDPDPDDSITYQWSSDCPSATFGPVATEASPALTFNPGSACSGECTVYLTVTDDLGHATNCQATVTVDDTSPPGFDTFPSDKTVECGQSTDPTATGSPTGSDDCGTVAITHADAGQGACGDTEVITRTWRVQDACGFVVTRDQIITVRDTTNPTFDTFPADAVVECGDPTDPAATGQPTGSDNCGAVAITHSDQTTPGPGGSTTIVRTWRIEDACGRVTTRDQSISVEDTSGPVFNSFPPDATVECGEPTDPASTGQATASDVCGQAVVSYTDAVQPGCGETEVIVRTWRAADDRGQVTTRDQIVTVVDTTPPSYTSAPGDVTFECDGLGNGAAIQAWLNGAAGTDTCGTASVSSDYAGLSAGCGATGSATVTWTLTDECQNTTPHVATVTVLDSQPPDITCPPDVSLQAGGSTDPSQTGYATASDVCDAAPLITYQDVDSGAGQTKITRTWTAADECGRYSSCVQIIAGERAHPGWNWADVMIRLTADEPARWSASTGLPKGVAPLTVLDLGDPPGRPDPEAPGERVLRGYVVGYAVDVLSQEIHWNHLLGDAMIVDYREGSAWQYRAWTFTATDAVPHGQLLGTPGQLFLNGSELVGCYDMLLFGFLATGGVASSGVHYATADTDLTLFPVDLDVRQETTGPVTTTAVFDIWNMNESKFSGAQRCITYWDQTLLSNYGSTHFLRDTLQTDNGVARIDGVATPDCTASVASPLLGVAMRRLVFQDGRTAARSGENLFGMGSQSALIQADISEIPPQRVGSALPPAPGSLNRGSDAANGRDTVAGARKRVDAPVVSTNKGTLVIFSAVEIRWDAKGHVIQDTFLELTNDHPAEVWVQLYLINGDPPLEAQ